MYVLNIDKETNRVLSAAIMPHPPSGAVLVDMLPDGDVTDYLYVNGKYVHDPLPKPESTEPEPTDGERIDALEAKLASYEAAYAEGVNEA